MAESVQQSPSRQRPPRVKITYDVETGGTIGKRELPFCVGVFADLSGDRDPDLEFPPCQQRRMLPIDRELFNDVMKTQAPRVALGNIARIPSAPGPTPAGAQVQQNLSGAISFDSLDAFEPVAIVKAIPELNRLYRVRSNIRMLQSRAESSDRLNDQLNLLVAKTADGAAARARLQVLVGLQQTDDNNTIARTDDPAQAPARRGIDAVFALMDAAGLKSDEERQQLLGPLGFYVSDVLARIDLPGSTWAPGSAMTAIDSHIADIDGWLSRQLSAIMHAPKFQEVEATWRGLHDFVSNTETGKMLKISVFNAKKDELLDDMQKAVDKDQSRLFRMICGDPYGSVDGMPYSLLLGGYEIGRGASDIDFLRKIAEVAASAHAPFITAASAGLFGLDSFRDLAKPRYLQKIFESIELAGWQEFRESEASRYVTVVMPHVLLRLPYGKAGRPVDGMDFEESVGASPGSPDSGSFLWGNAAYMLAQRVTNAFSLYNWTAAIRGVEGGGLVEDLPTYSFRTDSGAEALFCPTGVSISDRREQELNDLGFIALCHCKGQGKAAFFGGQTAHQPKTYFSESANAKAQIPALPYMLAASRFAHYIKVIMRAKVGSFLTRANVEAFLNAWISNYVLLDDDAPQQVKASYPLRQALVVVEEVAGEPGRYRAVLFLRPHFQLEELTTSIRLVVDL